MGLLRELAMKRTKRGTTRAGIQSVDTGLAVAFLVARAGKAVALTHIAKHLDILPSTAHRHLASLSRAGLIEQVGDGGHYDLGPAAIEFGLAALQRLDTQKLWIEAITSLRDATDLTSLSIVWGNLGPTVVQWKESRQPVWINAHIGTVLPLTRSAAGLVYCAYPPSRTIASAIEKELASRPAPTHRGRRLNHRSLQTMLARIRKAGYALIDGDLVEGVAAASAPVFDATGQVKLALSILGPSKIINLDPASPHISALLEVTRRLSTRLGYAEPAGKGE